MLLRTALVLFVAAIASALVGLAGDGGVPPIVARVGFYALIPVALVVAVIGLIRAPTRELSNGPAPADR